MLTYRKLRHSIGSNASEEWRIAVDRSEVASTAAAKECNAGRAFDRPLTADDSLRSSDAFDAGLGRYNEASGADQASQIGTRAEAGSESFDDAHRAVIVEECLKRSLGGEILGQSPALLLLVSDRDPLSSVEHSGLARGTQVALGRGERGDDLGCRIGVGVYEQVRFTSQQHGAVPRSCLKPKQDRGIGEPTDEDDDRQ